MLDGMARSSLQRRGLALTLAGAALVLAAVAAIVIWDPFGSLVRSLDLSGSLPDVPDVPKWLLFLVGKGKLILIAAAVLLFSRCRSRPKESS
jgi:hypothetical protein